MSESQLLEQELQKYIIQAEFDQKLAKQQNKQSNLDFKLEISFFKQQFSLLVQPCKLMISNLQRQAELCMEDHLRNQKEEMK